ncbi:MAG: endonuclease/exonuclease/phosphatase family protein [Treponema sp.]|nr:endonuclease/exonuclease/phosphatase family protein [Treponema sp.]
MRKNCVCFLLNLCLGFVMSSCMAFADHESPSSSGKAQEIKIACWNVQTFFDSVTEGTEYSDFIKNKAWNEDAYRVRLERLASAIKEFDADVVILEEIENESVMHDIANYLAGEWSARKAYSHACFARNKGGAIGVGVLSRLELSSPRVHSLDIRGQSEMPDMRPLLQVTVHRGGHELTLFVNHWKSMSGGKEETEVWRQYQEGLLARRMAEKTRNNEAVLACGDFNRDLSDFSAGNEKGTVVLNEFLEESELAVKSLWYTQSDVLVEPGSYYYEGEWSRIDHFFTSGPVEVLDFTVQTDGPWCNETTHVPERYMIFLGKGYSDHLPISCRVRF